MSWPVSSAWPGLLPWERWHCDGGEFVLDAGAVSWTPRSPGMEGPGRSNKEDGSSNCLWELGLFETNVAEMFRLVRSTRAQSTIFLGGSQWLWRFLLGNPWQVQSFTFHGMKQQNFATEGSNSHFKMFQALLKTHKNNESEMPPQ